MTRAGQRMPTPGARGEGAVVAHEVRLGRWNQRGEPAQELGGKKHKLSGAVREGALHAIAHPTALGECEALECERRAQAITALPLETQTVVRVDGERSMEGEAVCLLAAIAGVWLDGTDNNIFTQIGLFVLVGLSCKNAILIVEFAKDKQEESANGDPVGAVLEACRLRLRPILMTSMAFIMGVWPLVSSTGAGAEMRHAMGIAVFAGMIGVTLFGLGLTPCSSRRCGGWRGGGRRRRPMW
jgi:hypothetical protein